MSTTKLFALILLALTLLTARLFAVVPPLTSLTLAWDKAPSHGANISYVLKWGPQVGATNFMLSVGTNLTAVVTNPTTGFLYFHVVARTPEGLESEPSNTVIQTNYPAKPLELRITTNTTSSLRIEGTSDGAATWIHLATVTRENMPVTIPATANQLLIRSKVVVPPPPLPQ